MVWRNSLSLSTIIDALFPPLCPGCGQRVKANSFFCNECHRSLLFIEPPICQVCGRSFSSKNNLSHICGECLKNPPSFKAARSVFIYNEPIKKAISNFKFKGHTNLGGELAKLMFFHLNGFLEEIMPQILIPIPLHIKRLRERGYNQCVLLAKKMAKSLKIPCESRLLRKIKSTSSQVGLCYTERKKNVKGSFFVSNPTLIQGKRILLIDDIFTTGSTVNECAKVLLKAKANGVWVVTLAITADEI
jgi:ComF family protein